MSGEYRCSNCGAPLDVSPETIAIVCSYCVFLNWIREDLKEEEVLVVKPIDEGQALKKLVASTGAICPLEHHLTCLPQ